MRIIAVALALMANVLAAAPGFAKPDGDRVLIVVSSEGRDQGKTRPGFEFDEFAQAWTIFRANGLEVEVASPAGGNAEPDEYESDKVYNAAALADPEAAQALAATQATASVDARRYAGVYIIGGGGAMFDVFSDRNLHGVIARAYESGAVVGGVCHGPAVLANVRLSDGSLLVSGKRLTGFTNAEEAGFGKRWAPSYPVFLETALRESGAQFEQTGVMLPFAVTDGRLVTGQNPFSTAVSVEAMIRAMGREPVARTPYPDERALQLAAGYLKGHSAQAEKDLAAAPEAFDVMLIGIYGTIIVGQANGNAAQIRSGLGLMELAARHISNPRLELARAQAELQLGNNAAARARLQRILENAPDNEAARKLLAGMKG